MLHHGVGSRTKTWTEPFTKNAWQEGRVGAMEVGLDTFCKCLLMCPFCLPPQLVEGRLGGLDGFGVESAGFWPALCWPPVLVPGAPPF